MEGLSLIANRAPGLEPDEVIAAFEESVILKGRVADEAHELIVNFDTTCTVSNGFQYSIRRKLASETIHLIVMPSADRLLALSQRGISPGLRKALTQGTPEETKNGRTWQITHAVPGTATPDWK